jgi:hypothetical protein
MHCGTANARVLRFAQDDDVDLGLWEHLYAGQIAISRRSPPAGIQPLG